MKRRICTSTIIENALTRRAFMLAGAALAVPNWVNAQTTPKAAAVPRQKTNTASRVRPTPLTAAEESAAAKTAAEALAEEVGGQVPAAIGTSPRLQTTFTLFDGRPFSEAQTSGKLLFVFYWASWCQVCKVVSPRLNEFRNKYHARGVEVLALSLDTDVHAALSYYKKAGYRFPAAMANAATFSPSITPSILPTLMVRSKLGVILNVEMGELAANELKDFLVHL